MHHFVVDNGWTECGIRDADGSIADIGAVPFGNQISSRVRILPVNYITESTPEHIPFILESDSPLSNCRIEYSRLIDISISDTNAFGNTVKPHTLSNIHDVTTTDEISTGFNQISCQINNNNGSLKKGFFELVIGKYLGEKSG